MKYLLGLILITGCTKTVEPPNPEFHFMDKVKVIGGFYSGCSGSIEEKTHWNAYSVRMGLCRESWPGEKDIISYNLELETK